MSSGRRVSERPPWSSKVYISLVTMSVDSPTPREKTRGVLEHRRLDVAVAGPAQRRGEGLADGEEPRGVRRQHVERALGGAKVLTSAPSHSSSGPGPASVPRPPRRRYGLVARSRPIVVGRPVAGQHHGLVVQRQDDVPQRPQHRVPRPAGQVHAADGAGEQHVAGEQARAPRPGRAENITDPWVWPGACAHGQVHPGQREHARRRPARWTSAGSGSRTPLISGASAGPCQRAGSLSMPKSSGCS